MSYWNGCCAKPGLHRLGSRGGRVRYREMSGCTLKSPQRCAHPPLNCSFKSIVSCPKRQGERGTLFVLMAPVLKDRTTSHQCLLPSPLAFLHRLHPNHFSLFLLLPLDCPQPSPVVGVQQPRAKASHPLTDPGSQHSQCCPTTGVW